MNLSTQKKFENDAFETREAAVHFHFSRTYEDNWKGCDSIYVRGADMDAVAQNIREYASSTNSRFKLQVQMAYLLYRDEPRQWRAFYASQQTRLENLSNQTTPTGWSVVASDYHLNNICNNLKTAFNSFGQRLGIIGT